MYKKRIAAALLAALLSLGWVLSASASSVTANNGKISLTLPDKYTTVENTASSIADHADFISTLGHSTDSFTSYLKEAGILLFAATADNTSQVQIKSWSTDFSEKLGNLALFSDDEDSLNQAAESLVTESTGETVIGISRVAKSDGTLSLRIRPNGIFPTCNMSPSWTDGTTPWFTTTLAGRLQKSSETRRKACLPPSRLRRKTPSP